MKLMLMLAQVGCLFGAQVNMSSPSLGARETPPSIVPSVFSTHRYEFDQLPPPYEDPYSSSDLLAYLDACRGRCGAIIEDLQHDARDLLGCQRLEADGFEVLLYHLRHVQHHAAQLNQLLRQTVGDAPLWVRRARL